MGWINRKMIGRLERKLAAATDHTTRSDIDCRLAYRELMEKRGTFPPLPWRWLAVAAFIGAFWLPQTAAVIVAGAAGLWLGFVEGRK